MMKNKKLLMTVLALAAAAVVLVGIYLSTRPNTAAGAKTISVSVIHKDGTEKDFSYTTEEEYLGAVLLAEGLVEGEDSTYGLLIHAVDGERASWDEDQSYWALYIGEDYAATGADTTPISDGGSYKLVYTIG